MVKSIVLVIIFSLMACTGVETKPEDANETLVPEKDNFSRFTQQEKESPENARQNKSTGNLLSKATQYEKDGNYQRSIAIIERSLRIDPENAYLWYRLANAYFKSGNYQRAIQFAQRSNSYSARDKSQQNINKNLINHARLYISEN